MKLSCCVAKLVSSDTRFLCRPDPVKCYLWRVGTTMVKTRNVSLKVNKFSGVRRKIRMRRNYGAMNTCILTYEN
jgi:hypothetical protein